MEKLTNNDLVLIIGNKDGEVKSKFVISGRLADNLESFLRDCQADGDPVMEVVRIVQ